ncbi:cellulose 1,4-beta-cellobiosidase [Sesbania bispinosa]|nr:cellulose 1,4-beta-cellobiosidase [Sesbania bispinosa]
MGRQPWGREMEAAKGVRGRTRAARHNDRLGGDGDSHGHARWGTGMGIRAVFWSRIDGDVWPRSVLRDGDSKGKGFKAVARRHEPAYRGRRRSRVVCSGGLPNGGHVSRRWCDGGDRWLMVALLPPSPIVPLCLVSHSHQWVLVAGGVHLATAGMWYRRQDRPCFATEVVLWPRLAADGGGRGLRAVVVQSAEKKNSCEQ